MSIGSVEYTLGISDIKKSTPLLSGYVYDDIVAMNSYSYYLNFYARPVLEYKRNNPSCQLTKSEISDRILEMKKEWIALLSSRPSLVEWGLATIITVSVMIVALCALMSLKILFSLKALCPILIMYVIVLITTVKYLVYMPSIDNYFDKI